MTFPTVTNVLDEFNRANERPVTGGAWQPSEFGGGTTRPLGVNSNQLIGTAAGGAGTFGDQWWNEVIGPDLESRVELAVALTSGDEVHMIARLQNAGTSSADGYACTFERAATLTLVRIFRLDNGAYTQLGDVYTLGGGLVPHPAIGDEFGFECHGSSLRAWHWSPTTGWEVPAVRVDSTYPNAGAVGLRVYDLMRVDRWICGTSFLQPSTSSVEKRVPIGPRSREAQ